MESKIKISLDDTDHGDVDAFSDLFTTTMVNRTPYFVSNLDDEAIISVNEKMQLIFGQHIFVAYYDEREILYFAFNFASIKNGWQLDSFDFGHAVLPYKVADLL